MQQLQAQARRSFRYWPVLLVLRMRRLEQHVTSEQRAALPTLTAGPGPSSRIADLALLTEYGLPVPEALPSLDLPALQECPPARAYFFRVGQGAECATLDLLRASETGYQSYELLRMAQEDRWYLDKAVACLDRLLTDLGPAEALRQGQLWSLLHGGVPQSWAIVPSTEPQTTADPGPTLAAESELGVEATVRQPVFSDNGTPRRPPDFSWKE